MKDDRLISLNAALDVIEAGRLTKLIDAETAINGLRALPSAQPDIILCPNCRYNDGTAYCELHYRDVKAKDFCSWAERRE